MEDKTKYAPGWVVVIAVLVLVVFVWGLIRISSPPEQTAVSRTVVAATPVVTHSADQTAVNARPKKVAQVGTATVEMIRYRVVPFHTALGEDAHMVLIDWKNTGNSSIRLVKADIDVFDAEGIRLDSSERNYTIYSAFRTSSGIKPGQTYRTKQGEGYVLLPIFGSPKRVIVRITGAASLAKF